MESDHTQPSKANGHEPLGVDDRAIWRAGAGLAAIVVGALLAVAGVINLFAASDPATSAKEVAADQVPMPPNIPQLDPDQPIKLRQLHQREEDFLGRYQWIDKTVGTARIPIDRAIQIVAAKGLPVTPSAVTPQPQSSQPTQRPSNSPNKPVEAPASEPQ